MRSVLPRLVLSGVALAACSAGTEPSPTPRELRGDPGETGLVRGAVVTAEEVPLAGVVVELGIVHFHRAADTAAGTGHAAVVPFVVADVWSGPGRTLLTPGPAEPPGRFEPVARTTTDERGRFEFRRVSRQTVLMVRARPPAPYEETYSQTPFWLTNSPARELSIVLRGGP